MRSSPWDWRWRVGYDRALRRRVAAAATRDDGPPAALLDVAQSMVSLDALTADVRAGGDAEALLGGAAAAAARGALVLPPGCGCPAHRLDRLDDVVPAGVADAAALRRLAARTPLTAAGQAGRDLTVAALSEDAFGELAATPPEGRRPAPAATAAPTRRELTTPAGVAALARRWSRHRRAAAWLPRLPRFRVATAGEGWAWWEPDAPPVLHVHPRAAADPPQLAATLAHEVLGHGGTDPWRAAAGFRDDGAVVAAEGFATWCEPLSGAVAPQRVADAEGVLLAATAAPAARRGYRAEIAAASAAYAPPGGRGCDVLAEFAQYPGWRAAYPLGSAGLVAGLGGDPDGEAVAALLRRLAGAGFRDAAVLS